MTYSEDFGCLDRGRDSGVLDLTRRFFACAAWIGYAPWVARIHAMLAPWTGTWLDIGIRSHHFGNLTTQRVRDRLRRGSDNHDMVGLLQEIRHRRPWTFSESDMSSMLRSNMVAGTYTVSTTLTMAVWYLLQHPDVRQRFESGLSSQRQNVVAWPSFSVEQAQELPLLEQIIYETLRCHSPFAQQLPRTVPAGGLVIAGKFFLPAGVFPSPLIHDQTH